MITGEPGKTSLPAKPFRSEDYTWGSEACQKPLSMTNWEKKVVRKRIWLKIRVKIAIISALSCKFILACSKNPRSGNYFVSIDNFLRYSYTVIVTVIDNVISLLIVRKIIVTSQPEVEEA